MYEVIVKNHFSAAHQLKSEKGVYENLHGHNWKIDVVVEAPQLDAIGTVIDFSVVEHETQCLVDLFDHRVLNELKCFEDLNPSSENVARFCFESLKEKLKAYPIQLKKVTIWETDFLGASYRGEVTS
ncbi:MAG: 6-carboxytetrahydropterin synthase [Deltaproteobacteria bacterium]|nr:6-carboxytetrahydropterin synthase [Deltaproteobacteria bacterium]